MCTFSNIRFPAILHIRTTQKTQLEQQGLSHIKKWDYIIEKRFLSNYFQLK